jgi:23S rRNA (pseudouridine1915-N3)-methyltransferase
MNKIRLTVIGKLQNNFAKEYVAHYEKLIGHHCELEIKYLKAEKIIEGKNEADVLRKEGERIIEEVGTNDFLVILDRSGNQYQSKDFAKFLGEYCTRSDVSLHFVIGGALGISEKILKFADMRLSLSNMTFAHQLTLVIFLEQLYRAITIFKGLPYHK